MADAPLWYITFLRHGVSVGNLENLFQGHANFPLTDTLLGLTIRKILLRSSGISQRNYYP